MHLRSLISGTDLEEEKVGPGRISTKRVCMLKVMCFCFYPLMRLKRMIDSGLSYLRSGNEGYPMKSNANAEEVDKRRGLSPDVYENTDKIGGWETGVKPQGSLLSR